ncbi:hypothetical protein CHISP_0191 [Chitinispirillum alkaliphilum]|nr:hypothetical protein CHISP_0191 [Chitinispirillum alkaliphilum]
MSSGRGQINFQELIRVSRLILIVEKAEPYRVDDELRFGEGHKGGLQTTLYRYSVIEVLKNSHSGIELKDSVEVYTSYALDNLEQTRRYLEGLPMFMTIQYHYNPGRADVTEDKNFIIFLKYETETKRFYYSAINAFESSEMASEVKRTIRGPDPIKPSLR